METLKCAICSVDWKSVAKILDAVAWPILALALVLMFKRQIREVIDRIQWAELPGGFKTVFRYGATPIDRAVADVRQASPATGMKLAALCKPATTYWLGHDLMWTLDIILRGASRDEIVHGFRQSLLHARNAELSGTPLVDRLSRLHDEAAQTLVTDWSPVLRLRFANEISILRTEIGRVFAAQQPDYASTE
jgi:hypothetical protein